MREQKGYVFHKGGSWFVRYADNVLVDGKVVRKLLCRKLDVPYGGQYRTKASVKPFVREFLAPINAGTVNAASTMFLEAFVDGPYFEWAERNLRVCTVSGYRQMWEAYLKPRVGKVALRDFRTVTGEKLLADIAAQHGLGRRTLQHIKAFLSGVFVQAKRLGVIDTPNPITDVSIPRVGEPEETHAYSLEEVNKMLLALADKPVAYAAVMLAALTGMRKSEIRGLRWMDYNGTELSVNRSVVDGIVDETKSQRSKAPVPCVRMLADALHSLRMSQGKLAAPNAPILQMGNGKPRCLDNLARKHITPALEGTGVEWQGWHAFRRGCATVLHAMKIDDVTIQRILRHSSVAITQAAYIKSLSEAQTNAMDALENALKATIEKANQQRDTTCTNLATPPSSWAN